jgi:hypothetical protein
LVPVLISIAGANSCNASSIDPCREMKPAVVDALLIQSFDEVERRLRPLGITGYAHLGNIRRFPSTYHEGFGFIGK